MNELAQHKFSDAIQIIWKEINTHAPRLTKVLYPKRILPPSDYFNPKWYATSMSVLYRNWVELEHTMLPHTTGAMMGLMASKYGLPFYFIQNEFAEAVAQTDPPEDFFLKDIQFPMPAMAFVLPDAFVCKHFKYYSPFIGVATAPPGVYPDAAMPYPKTELNIQFGNRLQIDQERILFHFPIFHGGDRVPTDYTGNYPLASNLSVIQDANLCDATAFERAEYETKYGEVCPVLEAGPTGEEEAAYLKKVIFFTVKLLLALTAEPQYIVPGGLQRKEKLNRKGQIEREALWCPTMIGANFRAIRESSGPGTGTHGSPRWHWRRRRMTYQTYGHRGPDFVYRETLPKDEKGRVDWVKVPDETRQRFWANHKLIWLKPTLVNAPEASPDLQKTAKTMT